jgi:hypothetical protein
MPKRKPTAEAAPPPLPQPAPSASAVPVAATKSPRSHSKLAAIIARLKDPDGATIAEIQALTGWQAHSVRGALAGSLKKEFGLTIVSEVLRRGRVYRVVRPKVAKERPGAAARRRVGPSQRRSRNRSEWKGLAAAASAAARPGSCATCAVAALTKPRANAKRPRKPH